MPFICCKASGNFFKISYFIYFFIYLLLLYFIYFRVFGHFEKPIFLKLCKHTDILNLPAGAYLFKVGECKHIQ